MNDSLRTNVFVRFQPETIACACIFLAARALQVGPAPPRPVCLGPELPLNQPFSPADPAPLQAPLVPAVWSHRGGHEGDLRHHTEALHQEEGWSPAQPPRLQPGPH